MSFKLRQARVGDRWSETASSVSDVRFEANGQEAQTHRETLKEYLTEVLQVDDGRPIKVRIRYQKYLTKQSENGAAPQSVTGAVEGNVYLAERKDGILSITAESGTPLSNDEKNIVLGDYEGLGSVSAIDMALVSKPRAVGESLEDVATAWGEKFSHDAAAASGGKSAPAKVDLVLNGIDADVATVDAKVESVVRSRGATFTTELSGKLHIAVGAVDSLEQGDSVLSGPLTITGAAQGSGATSITFKIRHL